MGNFELTGIQIPRFQKETQKKGIQKKQNWTSEDVNNPVYSKKKPLSIEKQEEIFIKDRQKQGAAYFDKAAQIGFGIARLHPTYGTAMNLIDISNNLKDAKEGKDTFIDYFINLGGLLGKGTYNLGTEERTKFKNVVQRARAKLGNPVLKAMGIMLGFPDYILDAKNLYNTITK